MHNVVNTTDVNLFSVHYSLCDIIFRQRNICGHSNHCVVLATTAKIYKPLNYKNQVVTHHYVATDAQQNVFLPITVNQDDYNSIPKGSAFR